MTVLSGEQMAALARRRKEGDTLLDILKGWPDGAGFSHYKVRGAADTVRLDREQAKVADIKLQLWIRAEDRWGPLDELDTETINT